MKFFLLGEKLGHSISPRIHSELSMQDGIKSTYDLKPVAREGFKVFAEGCRELDYSGFNVTIPYKQDIIPYLDFIDDEAKKIDAVNTVKIKDGKLYGYNTDIFGFEETLKTLLGEQLTKIKKVLLLGYGGAGVMCAYSLMNRDVELYIAVRSPEKIMQPKDINSEIIGLAKIGGDYDLIINSTPVGMFPKIEESLVDFSKVTTKYAFDLIYNPDKTKFLADAEKQNAVIANGVQMLIYQAARARELWVESSSYSEQVLKTIADVLKRNI